MARNPSMRRSARAVALALVCLFWYPVVARADPYDARTEEIFQAVARIMGVNVRDEVSRPRILVGEEVDPATFARYVGFDTGGKIFSAYFPEPNLIVLREWKRHTLAHEFVHYFQVKYQGYDPLTEGDTRDTSEREATAIERYFDAEERIGDGSRDSSH
jgi:hypothetical protein